MSVSLSSWFFLQLAFAANVLYNNHFMQPLFLANNGWGYLIKLAIESGKNVTLNVKLTD
ncbi:hypothetical protein [Vibrio azureus]|uniref:hypothetical protein n=1 Tax=Vibrio azureus TaxID=512649 RepID=UPI00039D5B04|nr:hypothetical protein [Vibrio azureus]